MDVLRRVAGAARPPRWDATAYVAFAICGMLLLTAFGLDLRSHKQLHPWQRAAALVGDCQPFTQVGTRGATQRMERCAVTWSDSGQPRSGTIAFAAGSARPGDTIRVLVDGAEVQLPPPGGLAWPLGVAGLALLTAVWWMGWPGRRRRSSGPRHLRGRRSA
ncbi:hypothetical protein [Longispora fulva]|uniref:Uncharacterized protein n=1 Tax=Longispora fulva TaxID=619741 RepID=A0A8J7KJV8_9ACTN|nr:hypothetical protein [Longispora fulva]MBG6135921.1 hypothetical protein [Longispora fulva]